MNLQDRIEHADARADEFERKATEGGPLAEGCARHAEEYRLIAAALRAEAEQERPLRGQSWPRVFMLMESAEQRDGLNPGGDIAATLAAAMHLADERAGRYAAEAGPWEPDGYTVGIEWQNYTRQVPGLGWQHIHAQPLHGDADAPGDAEIKQAVEDFGYALEVIVSGVKPTDRFLSGHVSTAYQALRKHPTYGSVPKFEDQP